MQSTFAYDIDNNRVEKTVDNNGQLDSIDFVIDNNQDYAQVVQELDANTAALNVSYTFGDDLLSQTRAGQLQIYHYDGLGSTRLLTDISGTTTDLYDYEAFGEVLNQAGSSENDYLYTGEQFDAELDQYYLRARYYDAGVGRFLGMDEWGGCNVRPSSINKYVYGESNPAINTDPSGNSIMQMGISVSILGTINATQIAYTGATIAASFAAYDIVNHGAVTVWAISESSSPNINSEREAVLYYQENRRYKNRCNEKEPKGLTICEKWRWKLKRNKECADLRDAFGKRWFNSFDENHKRIIDQYRVSIKKLEKNIANRCK